MRALFLATALIAAGLSPALAQPLLCPPVASAAGKPCETFHFHVQLFRPESRDFIEVYGVNQFDAATFALTSILLSMLVLIASFGPARRAVQVDPMIALRDE